MIGLLISSFFTVEILKVQTNFHAVTFSLVWLHCLFEFSGTMKKSVPSVNNTYF